jgi:hypothetical protein
MRERLAETIGEVRSGARALSSAAAQLSQTSQSLSNGTAEQASQIRVCEGSGRGASHHGGLSRLLREGRASGQEEEEEQQVGSVHTRSSFRGCTEGSRIAGPPSVLRKSSAKCATDSQLVNS